jgi:hypothetical protein
MDNLTNKAQRIVNEVDQELGITLVAYENSELEFLRKKLTQFLALGVPTDDLVDADESDLSDMDDEEVDFGEEDE